MDNGFKFFDMVLDYWYAFHEKHYKQFTNKILNNMGNNLNSKLLVRTFLY